MSAHRTVTIVFPRAEDRRLLMDANGRPDWFEGSRRALCLTPDDWDTVLSRVACQFGDGDCATPPRADVLVDEVLELVRIMIGADADEIADDPDATAADNEDYIALRDSLAVSRCHSDRKAPIPREWALAWGRRAR